MPASVRRKATRVFSPTFARVAIEGIGRPGLLRQLSGESFTAEFGDCERVHEGGCREIGRHLTREAPREITLLGISSANERKHGDGRHVVGLRRRARPEAPRADARGGSEEKKNEPERRARAGDSGRQTWAVAANRGVERAPGRWIW